MNDDLKTSPRIFTAQDLAQDNFIELEADRAHYLAHVLRSRQGDKIRLFNGRGGEYAAVLHNVGKKNVTAHCKSQIRGQHSPLFLRHLYFAPIKKTRQDFLIEKAVELGVTHLHPVLTNRTQIRKINLRRLEKQIIEAAEQCERLDIPRIFPMINFRDMIKSWKEQDPKSCFICLARCKGKSPSRINSNQDISLCIGPEGGFDEQEISLANDFASLNLGDNVLRAETAALSALARLMPVSE